MIYFNRENKSTKKTGGFIKSMHAIIDFYG